jgi:hypothetical protein
MPFCAAVVIGFYRLRRYKAFVIPAVLSIVLPVLWAWRPQRFIVPSLSFLVIALVAAVPALRPSRLLAVLAIPVSIALVLQVADTVRKGITASAYDRYPGSWKQVRDVQHGSLPTRARTRSSSRRSTRLCTSARGGSPFAHSMWIRSPSSTEFPPASMQTPSSRE